MSARVQLVHDVLDMQLVDRNGVKMGRVDGIVVELRDDGPPRVVELVIGGTVLADRVGSWAAWLLQLLSVIFRIKPVVTRIPFAVVDEIADVVKLDVEADETTALRTEHFLDRIVCAIPGAAGRRGTEK